ncbi:MAG: NAD(P)-dependent dehydrogenase (short-subunit alcohol dehydrogenase family) [Candidatus Latescibacterota bacterium]|jgi:NAD(P)-dependent dehydrogenase (short-subunit alcohol dehydrogenase family)
MSLFDLSGQVAVVIGGTGVLGGAIARGLAEHGAKVAVMGRNQERGLLRVEEIQAAGGEGAFVACDATDAASLKDAHATLRRELGEVGVLVNAAGGNQAQVSVSAELAFEEIALEDWRGCFDLNLVGGALLPCQEFGPAMVSRGQGSIINIASIAAHIPPSRVVAYSAAKAAVVSLTQFLAREWATKGVRVNSLTPGFFPAEQNRRLLYEEDGSPTQRAREILAHTPMDRFGVPEELVGAAVFLASASASGFITGTDVRVDGGFLSTTI